VGACASSPPAAPELPRLSSASRCARQKVCFPISHRESRTTEALTWAAEQVLLQQDYKGSSTAQVLYPCGYLGKMCFGDFNLTVTLNLGAQINLGTEADLGP